MSNWVKEMADRINAAEYRLTALGYKWVAGAWVPGDDPNLDLIRPGQAAEAAKILGHISRMAAEIRLLKTRDTTPVASAWAQGYREEKERADKALAQVWEVTQEREAAFNDYRQANARVSNLMLERNAALERANSLEQERQLLNKANAEMQVTIQRLTSENEQYARAFTDRQITVAPHRIVFGTTEALEVVQAMQEGVCRLRKTVHDFDQVIAGVAGALPDE